MLHSTSWGISKLMQFTLDCNGKKKKKLLLESFQVLLGWIILHFPQAKSRQSIYSTSFGKFYYQLYICSYNAFCSILITMRHTFFLFFFFSFYMQLRYYRLDLYLAFKIHLQLKLRKSWKGFDIGWNEVLSECFQAGKSLLHSKLVTPLGMQCVIFFIENMAYVSSLIV